MEIGDLRFRPWVASDEPFLWDMMFLSLHVRAGAPPFERSVLSNPNLSHYLSDFGTIAGDDAQICTELGGARLGAAWCRRLPASDPGYGFVESETPELGMAVLAQHRGRGIGRTLLLELVQRHPIMSLSVDDENLVAKALYVSLGFVPISSSEGSTTMHRTD